MVMTDYQKGMVLRLYPFLSNQEIAEMLNIPEEVIRQYASKNGVIKINKPQREDKHRSIKYVTCKTPYWELVKQYKEATPVRRFNHPFFQPTQRIYKTKNENGTD